MIGNKLLEYSLCLKYSNILGLSLLIFIILEGLDAFSIRNIPIYWIGVSFLISVFGILYFSGFRISNLNLVNLRNWIIYGILMILFPILSTWLPSLI